MTKLSHVLKELADDAACWASTRWFRHSWDGGRWGIDEGQAPKEDQPERRTTTESTSAPPVFITARFRSGSTYLWNIFHHLGRYTAYYEPLHENRWFEKAARDVPVDETHIGTPPYHTNYQGLESLSEIYDERWTSHRLYMDARATDHQLKAYIQALIDHAAHQPVLQFNRVDFRLAWLRKQFPRARLLHIYRSPREQWMSSLGGASLPADITLADVKPLDLFYLAPWWDDLRCVFPGLRLCRTAHPYRAFYLLWLWSHAMAQQFADISIAYEQLAQAPGRVMRETLAALALPSDDIDWQRIEGMTHYRAELRWPEFASTGWFEEIERSCEEILRHALHQ